MSGSSPPTLHWRQPSLGSRLYISLAFTRNSINNPWAGLGRNLANDTKALMDDAPSEVDYYWSAIGMTFYHGQNDTIPGPLHHLVKKVELYVDTGRYKNPLT